jgi:hypothetical protein
MGRHRTTVAPGSTIVRLLAALIVGMAATGLAAACGPDGSAERPYEPTLPSPDFRPRLVLAIADDSPVRASPGERTDAAVSTDPPVVPSGSVISVRNAGGRDHRLKGGESFDTGILRPGEDTIVVLTNPGSDPQQLDLFEVTENRSVGRLTVEPAPDTGS